MRRLEPRALVPVAGRTVVATGNANRKPQQQLRRHDQSAVSQTDRQETLDQFLVLGLKY